MTSETAFHATPAGALEFQDRLISRGVERWAHSAPERVCIVQDDGLTVTYQQLDQRASAVARGLGELGVGVGDRVLTLGANDLYAVYTELAIAKLGAIEVPVNPALVGASLAHPIADAAPKAAVVASEHRDAVIAASPADAVPVTVVCPGAAAAQAEEAGPTLDGFLARYPGHLETTSGVESTDAAAIMYTSGTTGLPKGALVSHHHCFNIAGVAATAFGLTEQDTFIGVMPLFHGAGRYMNLAACLLTGARYLLVRRFSPGSFLALARAYEATVMHVIVAMAHFLLAEEPSPADREHRILRGGCAPLPGAVQRDFAQRFGIQLFSGYGSTEANAPLWNLNGPAGACGRAIEPYRVRIIDERDREVPVGQVGEIAVVSDEPWTMFSGYWNQPEATLRANRNYWFHTGDAGYIDQDGYVWFVDRVKDMIRRRGENVSAQTVENEVNALEGVVESGAYGIPSEYGEDEIAVAVVAAEGAALDADQVFEHCKKHLPKFAVPRYVRFVDALPKTATAKVRKVELRQQGTQGARERTPVRS